MKKAIMKIEFKEPNSYWCEFSTIKVGEIFIYANKVYMRVDSKYSNAVCLNNGTMQLVDIYLNVLKPKYNLEIIQ